MESQKSLTEDWFLWLLLLAAVGLTGAYYYFVFSASPEADDSPRWVLDGTDVASVTELRTYRGDTLTLALNRESVEGWTLTRPRDVELETSAADEWLNTLLSPEVKQRFSASPGSDYGFNTGSTRIEVHQGDRRHVFYLGGKDPTGQGFYLRYGRADTAPVFLLANRNRDKLSPDLYTLRDKSLFDQSYGELTGAEFVTDTGSVSYRRDGDSWVLDTPASGTLSETASRSVGDDLRTLLGITASTFYDTQTPSSLKPIRGRIHLRFRGTEISLAIGGREDDERLISLEGKPVMGVTVDPFRTFRDLPTKPDGWPVVEPSGGAEKPKSPRARKQMKELRQQMQAPPTGE